MRRAAAALLAVLATAPAACGGQDGKSFGDLVWVRRPVLVVPPSLPRDRILTGRVRNDGLRVLNLTARDARVIDSRGHRIRASAIFLAQYKHRMQPFNRSDPVPFRERRLSGSVADLRPGQVIPLTVSWHRPQGGGRPVRIELGGSSLEIPG